MAKQVIHSIFEVFIKGRRLCCLALKTSLWTVIVSMPSGQGFYPNTPSKKNPKSNYNGTFYFEWDEKNLSTLLAQNEVLAFFQSQGYRRRPCNMKHAPNLSKDLLTSMKESEICERTTYPGQAQFSWDCAEAPASWKWTAGGATTVPDSTDSGFWVWRSGSEAGWCPGRMWSYIHRFKPAHILLDRIYRRNRGSVPAARRCHLLSS